MYWMTQVKFYAWYFFACPLVGPRNQHAATETYFIAENTLTPLSFLIERIWLGNVSVTHNYPWLTKEPKHSLERSFGGEWHETAWVCGQPFFDDRNQSMEWSRGKEKCWPVGMSLMLRYRALSLSPDSFCFQLRTSVLVILVICRPLPWLLPFLFLWPHIAHQLFPANVPGVEYGVQYRQCWVLVWEQASCLCSAYSLQPKERGEGASKTTTTSLACLQNARTV